jgi:cephalosporin hydroxylase
VIPGPITPELQQRIEDRIMHGTTYRGVPTLKMPTDAWVYQEIIWELRPGVIVEIGNRFGGSLMMLTDMCLNLDYGHGHGTLAGVDIDHSLIDRGVRGVYLVTGDALDVYPQVAEYVAGRSCLVIEDSAHTYDHTLAVMRTYGQLVQPGGYMIVEDGVMQPVADALATFAAEQDVFVADREREWPITWNPGGYLKRVK